MRQLAKFSISVREEDFVLHLEDDAGEAHDFAASPEQLDAAVCCEAPGPLHHPRADVNGETADVVILTREGLDDLAAEGTVVADSRVDLARSFVGIAVKGGADHPDIATVSALRATLLGARSVAYSRIGASGIFFAQLIERMGIASEINARARIIPSGFTAEPLVTGEADLAVQQLSELKQVTGVEVVGSIPLHMQSPAVFSAGRLAASNRVVQSDRLLKYLASPEVAPVLRESGLEP